MFIQDGKSFLINKEDLIGDGTYDKVPSQLNMFFTERHKRELKRCYDFAKETGTDITYYYKLYNDDVLPDYAEKQRDMFAESIRIKIVECGTRTLLQITDLEDVFYNPTWELMDCAHEELANYTEK